MTKPVRLVAKRRRFTIDDIRDELVIDVWNEDPAIPTLAQVLNLSKNSAYAAVHAGEVPSLKLGRRYKIPVPQLLRVLGVDAAEAGPAA